MNTQTNIRQRGFTIIEVVLVLAIAGLIFLMVFIALPALQRNQRDTQRRTDLSTFVSQLGSYATNNKNKVPDNAAKLTAFKTGYLKWASDNSGSFNDPTSGVGYKINLVTGAAQPGTVGEINYLAGGKCDGETLTTGGTSRQAAVVMKLENNGFFCQTNLD